MGTKRNLQFTVPRGRWRRVLGFGLGLPTVFLLTAALVYYGEHHLAARASPTSLDAPILEPRSGQRILVIAPHPDDETLGCAGLIRRALQNGAEITVVVVTDGEAFGASVALEERTLEPSYEDYRDYTAKRRAESRAAMSLLGLPPERLRFLGYPDRGLAALWSRNWDAAVGSHRAAAPSSVPPRPGERFADDLYRLLAETRPHKLFVSHPLDDHIDHLMCYGFLEVALVRYVSGGGQRPAVYGYLVHRGDWPLPQGLEPNASLRPPPNFDDRGAFELPLTEEERKLKHAAVRRYRSQVRLLGRFLSSFVRRNELFFELPPPIEVSRRDIQLGDPTQSWLGLEPVSKEPVADTLVRNVTPGLDVEAVYSAATESLFHLRFDFAGRVSRRADYRVQVRWFDETGKSLRLDEKQIRPRRRGGREMVHWKANMLELTLRRPPKAAWAALRLESKIFRLTSDRTPLILVRLPEASAP